MSACVYMCECVPALDGAKTKKLCKCEQMLMCVCVCVCVRVCVREPKRAWSEARRL